MIRRLRRGRIGGSTCGMGRWWRMKWCWPHRRTPDWPSRRKRLRRRTGRARSDGDGQGSGEARAAVVDGREDCVAGTAREQGEVRFCAAVGGGGGGCADGGARLQPVVPAGAAAAGAQHHGGGLV